MKTQSILEHKGVRWKEAHPGEILYFVWHGDTNPEVQDFEIETMLIPEEDELEEDFFAPGDESRLIVKGSFAQTNDWAGLEESTLRFDPGIWIDDQPATARIEEPEVEFWSLGRKDQPGEIFACGCWETRIIFGKMDRTTLEVPYRVKAFHPTDECRKRYKFWLREDSRRCLPEDKCEETFKKTQLWEGWQIDFQGTAVATRFHCMVPVNSARPVDYARKMIARRLGFKMPLKGHVSGGDWLNGPLHRKMA